MLERLLYRPDGTKIGVPVHLFFYMTLVFGLAFVLPPSLLGTGASELFKFSAIHGVAVWWGSALLLTTAMNTAMLLTRNKWLGSVTGVMGFCCWLYAAIAYFIAGFPLGLLAAAIPNLIFWAWYSFRVSQWSEYLRP